MTVAPLVQTIIARAYEAVEAEHATRAANAIRFTILGQPASKANSRRPAFIGKGDDRRMRWIKSEAALGFVRHAQLQIPYHARQRLEGPVRVTIRIWYANERSDLDESLVLDILQDQHETVDRYGEDGAHRRARHLVQSGVYRNDRQVREKHIYWGLDRQNPRVEVMVEPMVIEA